MKNHSPYNPPERLWKYRPWNEYAKAMMVSGEIYFAKGKDLNDPFEFRYHEKIPSTIEEIDLYARELCAQQFPNDSIEERSQRFSQLCGEISNFNRNRKSGKGINITKFGLGVFCSSEIQDNILMWSHYASNHRGVCLSINPMLVDKMFRKVVYSLKLPSLSSWDILQITKNRDRVIETSRTKSPDWKYEQEWRTFNHPGLHSYPGCVDQVIIGAKASNKTIKDVVESAKQASQDIKVLFASMSERNYSLVIKNLDL